MCGCNAVSEQKSCRDCLCHPISLRHKDLRLHMPLIPKPTVTLRCLSRRTRLTQRLPITCVPKQLHVASVRDAMINRVRLRPLTALGTLHAQRMIPKVSGSSLFPCLADVDRIDSLLCWRSPRIRSEGLRCVRHACPLFGTPADMAHLADMHLCLLCHLCHLRLI